MSPRTPRRPTLSLLLFASLAVALAIAFLGGCGGKKKTDPASSSAAPAKAGVAVEVALAAPVEVREGIDVTGTLVARFAADVKTEIPGRIEALLVTEWVPVAKGTPLARIASRDVELRVRAAQAGVDAARAGLAEAESSAARAEREKTRMAKLREAGLATAQENENVDTEASAAASRVESARARVKAAEEDLGVTRSQMDKTLVLSPIDGVVASRTVNVGDIPGDKPIFHIVDNRTLDLTATVPTSEMSKVRAGQTVTFSTEAIPGRSFEAKVRQVNPVVNQADRTVGVQAEVRNPGDLRGGLFVKGRILTTAPRQLIAVPRSSLSAWDMGKKTATLLVVQGGLAKARTVATGAVMGDSVEIVSGLSVGEGYVVRGGFLVKDGDAVTPVSAPPSSPKQEG